MNLRPQLIVVPGGDFDMGCAAGLPDQAPVHRVSVRTIRVSRFAVTRAEYDVFCHSTGTLRPPCWDTPALSRPRQPAVGVSWFEAVAFTRWLSTITREPFRLPTECERERAARGLIAGRIYPWGDTPSPQGPPVQASEAPTEVDASMPNSLGIQGMADGVHEWCEDWYDPAWYAHTPRQDPRGPRHGTRRVSRGGSWRHAHATTPCAARSSLPPESHYTDYGFRVVAGD